MFSICCPMYKFGFIFNVIANSARLTLFLFALVKGILIRLKIRRKGKRSHA